MKLHGSLQTNMEGAVMSARRHRGRPVYPQTVAHWTDLLAYAWREISMTSALRAADLTHLAKVLEAELAVRPAAQG